MPRRLFRLETTISPLNSVRKPDFLVGPEAVRFEAARRTEAEAAEVAAPRDVAIDVNAVGPSLDASPLFTSAALFGRAAASSSAAHDTLDEDAAFDDASLVDEPNRFHSDSPGL